MSRPPADAEGEGHSVLSRANDRFGLVLALLLVTFIVLELGLTSEWMLPITVALQSATLLAVFAAARVPMRVQRITRLIAVVFVIASITALPVNGDAEKFTVALLNGVIVAVCPIVIARSIVRRRVIDVRTVLGALCIYVLLGMFFAFVYIAIGSIADQFFVQTAAAHTSDYLYFSFVTLTTTGFGDLTAAHNIGRAFVVLEALIGQIYLVTVVAVLVSNLGPARRASESGSAR